VYYCQRSLLFLRMVLFPLIDFLLYLNKTKRGSLSRLSDSDGTGRLAIFTVPSCFRETATTGLVKCGKGVVTWMSASANHMHSARAFLILLSVLYRDPAAGNPLTKNLQYNTVNVLSLRVQVVRNISNTFLLLTRR